MFRVGFDAIKRLWIMRVCKRVEGLQAVQGCNNDVLSKRASGHESI